MPSNNVFFRLYFRQKMRQAGIHVTLLTGQLSYFNCNPKCYCSALYLIRHGKTKAIKNGEFMSNNSPNSTLLPEAFPTINNTINEYRLIEFDNILYTNEILRIIQTTDYLRELFKENSKVKFQAYSCICGIDNGTWAGKRIVDFENKDHEIYHQREQLHNVFSKPRRGDSWADVLLRCSKLINLLNKNYFGKTVLLVSQGSVLQGLKIILHISSTPWENYSSTELCGFDHSNVEQNFGKMCNIL